MHCRGWSGRRAISEMRVRLALAALCAAIGLCVCGLAAGPATAEEDAEDDGAGARQGIVLDLEAGEGEIEAVVFGTGGRSNGHRTIETRLKLHLAELRGACELTDGQVAKLRLAGRGDVSRFFEKFDQIRKKVSLREADDDIWMNVMQLHAEFRLEMFGPASLYRKVLRRTLSQDQMAAYKKVEDGRQAYRSRATVDMAVVLLENFVPLQEVQRQKLIELLQKKLKPVDAGEYESYLVLGQIARLDEKELKPLFDEFQWKAMARQFEKFKEIADEIPLDGALAPVQAGAVEFELQVAPAQAGAPVAAEEKVE